MSLHSFNNSEHINTRWLCTQMCTSSEEETSDNSSYSITKRTWNSKNAYHPCVQSDSQDLKEKLRKMNLEFRRRNAVYLTRKIAADCKDVLNLHKLIAPSSKKAAPNSSPIYAVKSTEPEEPSSSKLENSGVKPNSKAKHSVNDSNPFKVMQKVNSPNTIKSTGIVDASVSEYQTPNQIEHSVAASNEIIQKPHEDILNVNMDKDLFTEPSKFSKVNGLSDMNLGVTNSLLKPILKFNKTVTPIIEQPTVDNSSVITKELNENKQNTSKSSNIQSTSSIHKSKHVSLKSNKVLILSSKTKQKSLRDDGTRILKPILKMNSMYADGCSSTSKSNADCPVLKKRKSKHIRYSPSTAKC